MNACFELLFKIATYFSLHYLSSIQGRFTLPEILGSFCCVCHVYALCFNACMHCRVSECICVSGNMSTPEATVSLSLRFTDIEGSDREDEYTLRAR